MIFNRELGADFVSASTRLTIRPYPTEIPLTLSPALRPYIGSSPPRTHGLSPLAQSRRRAQKDISNARQMATRLHKGTLHFSTFTSFRSAFPLLHRLYRETCSATTACSFTSLAAEPFDRLFGNTLLESDFKDKGHTHPLERVAFYRHLASCALCLPP